MSLVTEAAVLRARVQANPGDTVAARRLTEVVEALGEPAETAMIEAPDNAMRRGPGRPRKIGG